jgi:ketosteroid isomerase-like protein
VAGGTISRGGEMSAVKQELEQVAEAYRASFNRQDAAGVAVLYTTGGIHIGPAGPTSDVEGLYNTIFKAGFNHMGSNVAEAWSLGPDIALAMGKYRIAGKDQSGAPIERGGYWTGTYVREAGKWKIRMETALPI